MAFIDFGPQWSLDVTSQDESVILKVKTQARPGGIPFHMKAKNAMKLAIELARYAKFVDKSGTEYDRSLREAEREIEAEFESPSAKALRGEE
jgi:hypothetical protein